MQARQAKAIEAVQEAISKAMLGISYAAVGVAGAVLWILVQLPVGARTKELLVYAMAGCVGTFTLGWQMLRHQR